MKGQNASDEAAFLEEFYRGGEWLAQGDFFAAKLHLEQALRLNPNNEKTQNLLGLTYFKLNLWKDAAQIYEVLIRNNPGDATLHMNLGLVFLKQKNTSHAVREFEAAIELYPDNKKAHNYLGLALAQAGEYVRAREHFWIAGSDAMALRMNQILDESAKTLQPTQEPPAAPVAQEPAVAAEPVAVAGSVAVAEPAAAEESAAVEESSAAQESGTAEALIADSTTPPSELTRMLEDLNRDPMIETPSLNSGEFSSTSDSGTLPAEETLEEASNAQASNARSSQESEDVFPLPSAQRDSKVAERAPPPSTEEAPSKISQAVVVLPWPREGAELFQVEKEVVVITVQGELLTRLTGLLGAAGNLDAAPEMRRYRGRPTDSPFGVGQEQMQRLMGSGVLFIERATTEFASLCLDDGSLYLREENLFAFDEQLNFENGRLSGEEGWSIDMVHLRGEGKLLLRLKGVLRRIPVPASMSLRVPVSQLVGWYGQLTPILSTMVGRSTLVLNGVGSALISVASQRP